MTITFVIIYAISATFVLFRFFRKKYANEYDCKVRNRFEGCLYGQAIGDALGLGTEGLFKDGVEGYYPEGLTKYEQIVQDAHRRRWHQGDWTDDTDMMICIATAIIEHGGIVDDNTLHDIAANFNEWKWSPECKGIGALVHNVLSMGDYVDNPKKAAEIFWNLSNKKNAPNGGLMRTSVVGLLRDDVDKSAENICKLTHFDPRCVGSCVIVSEIIHSLVYDDKQLTPDEIRAIGEKYDSRIKPFIDLVLNNDDISALDLDEQYSAGYTLKTLSAALWCYFHSTNYMEGMLAVVNAGGDADTNAAVACAILGAKYGATAIPAYYKDSLWKKEEYKKLIIDLEKVLC